MEGRNVGVVEELEIGGCYRGVPEPAWDADRYSGQPPESRRNDDAGAVYGAGGDRGRWRSTAEGCRGDRVRHAPWATMLTTVHGGMDEIREKPLVSKFVK